MTYAHLRTVFMFPFAAAIVFALFNLMGHLIDPGPVTLGERVYRPLSMIVPQKLTDDLLIPETVKPQKITVEAAPPPPPKLTANKSDISLPAPVFSGSAPQSADAERLLPTTLDSIVINDRDIQAIRPPVPTYPTAAQRAGTEGQCEVRFDVDVQGKPFNIVPNCSSGVFESAARRAMQRASFAPMIINGRAVERRNVVYPIEFTLAD